MPELSHGGYVRLTTHGECQWLEHLGSGEVIVLPCDRHFELSISPTGFGFLVGQLRNPGAQAAPRTREWVKTFLKSSIHAVAEGRVYLKREDGAATQWLDNLARECEPRQCLVESVGSEFRDRTFSLCKFTVAVEGRFIFWDLPYVLYNISGRYSYETLKALLITVRDIRVASGLSAGHCISSARAQIAKARLVPHEGDHLDVGELPLDRATDCAKVSTELLMWLLVRLATKAARSNDLTLHMASAVFRALVVRFVGDGRLFLQQAGAGSVSNDRFLTVADGAIPLDEIAALLGRLSFRLFRRRANESATTSGRCNLCSLLTFMVSFGASTRIGRKYLDIVGAIISQLTAVVEVHRHDTSVFRDDMLLELELLSTPSGRVRKTSRGYKLAVCETVATTQGFTTAQACVAGMKIFGRRRTPVKTSGLAWDWDVFYGFLSSARLMMPSTGSVCMTRDGLWLAGEESTYYHFLDPLTEVNAWGPMQVQGQIRSLAIKKKKNRHHNCF
jgi:hypothetical protein